MTVLVAERETVGKFGRVGWVDAVRGAAILLMVLDHVLIQVDPLSSLRVGAPWSITRLSLPLFMLASAAVWRPSTTIRWRVWLVVFPEAVLYTLLVMPQPAIVMVLLLVFTLLDVLPVRWRQWYVLGVLGLLQALYVPLPAPTWTGYQPGLVLAWFAFARLAIEGGVFDRFGERRLRVLAFIGRHPNVWYLGHLVVIAVCVLTFGGGELSR